MESSAISFVPGMIVSLKSGGPAMTVAAGGHATATIKCRWFKASGDLAEAVFGAAELRRGWKPPQTTPAVAPTVTKLRALT